VQKWRLQPGKMFLIDTEGRIIDDQELKDSFTPVPNLTKQWIDSVRIKLDELKAC
jgi:hypothetical protein